MKRMCKIFRRISLPSTGKQDTNRYKKIQWGHWKKVLDRTT